MNPSPEYAWSDAHHRLLPQWNFLNNSSQSRGEAKLASMVDSDEEKLIILERSTRGKSRAFYDKRISQEVSGDALGTPCFHGYGRRNGGRRRKSVRGCIVSPDLSVLNLVIVKKGDNDLPGLTDVEMPRMRGPGRGRRASKIRKLSNLPKEDDVRKYFNTYRRIFPLQNQIWYLRTAELCASISLQQLQSELASVKKRVYFKGDTEMGLREQVLVLIGLNVSSKLCTTMT